MNISLHFESRLQASPEQLWRWITSVDGILREIRPLLSMSVPPGIRSLEDLEVVPRRPLFRSHMRLFGLLPLGTSQLTLLELTPGRGFIEQSPMTGCASGAMSDASCRHRARPGNACWSTS